jgi:hypothetical protein
MGREQPMAEPKKTEAVVAPESPPRAVAEDKSHGLSARLDSAQLTVKFTVFEFCPLVRT